MISTDIILQIPLHYLGQDQCKAANLRYVEGCAYFVAKVGEIMMLNPLEVFNVLDPLSARHLTVLKFSKKNLLTYSTFCNDYI